MDWQQYCAALRGKSVFFLGAGISHRDLIPSFVKAGARVTLCDRADRARLGDYADQLEAMGVALRLGDGYLRSLEEADLIFRSPGIDYTKPELQRAVEAGKEMTSEIETFFDLCEAMTIGITGSDGKTTTTTLIYEMLREQGRRVHLGGNIGRPLLPRIEDIGPGDIAVAELSSFQLISMKRSPDIAVVTNLVPNHLDHHKDMKEYTDAKRQILLHQPAGSVAVLYDEPGLLAAMREDVRGELRLFGPRRVENGCWFDESRLYMTREGRSEDIMPLSEIKLLGYHNRYNVAAAASALMDLADPDTIRRVAGRFTGVEHRLEPVRTLRGARWYNDSIATSPSRTAAGLRAFREPIILIAGGHDKKISFDPLAPEIVKRVKLLILMGDTADPIEAAVRDCPGFGEGRPDIVRVGGLGEAVALAAGQSSAGDVVLLSPASASFGMFANFEARGREFKRLVGELQ